MGCWRGLKALEELSKEERGTSTLMNQVAVLLQGQGKCSEAEPLLQKALTGRKKTLGPDHPDTLTSINNLALLYYT